MPQMCTSRYFPKSTYNMCIKGKITSPLCHPKHIWQKHFYVLKPKFRTISNQTFGCSHYCGLQQTVAQAHQGDPHCNIPHIQYNVHHNNN